MGASKGVTWKQLLIALCIGLVPWLVGRPDWLSVKGAPDVEPFKALDIPLAAAALVVWLAAVRWMPGGKEPRRIPVGIALFIAALPPVLASLMLPTTVSNDEQAYLTQAEHFASGSLSEPLAEPVDMMRRRQILNDPEAGIRCAKYPPGTAAALVPGVWLGWPALMVVLFGILDVWLVVWIARKLGLARPDRAGLLFALTPFFLLAQTSFQSEVVSLPATLGAYAALLRMRQPGARALPWGALVGALCGFLFLARPLTAVLVAAGLGLGMFVGAGGMKRSLAAVSGAVIGGVPLALLSFFYNQALTGDAFTAPYEVYAAKYNPWDVYPYFSLELAPSMADPFELALRSFGLQIARWSPALFGVLGAAAIGFWGLWRLRRADGGAALCITVLLPLAYSLHWYPGHWAYLGPLYSLEVLGLVTIGACAVLEAADDRWGRALIPATCIACVALFATRFGDLQSHTARRAAPQLAVAESDVPSNSVILYPYSKNRGLLEQSQRLYTPDSPPFTDGIVYLRQLPNRRLTRAGLEMLGLAGRPTFVFVPGEDGAVGQLLPADQ